MDKTNEAIKRTSEMLLSGWKMLMTSCPLCHTALMEKQNSKFCPKCNLPVVVSRDEIANFPALPPSSSLPHTVAEDKEYKFKSLEEEKKKYDQLQSRQKLTSARIGERLLLGWALLGMECRDCNTPLMSLNGIKYCVTCEKNIEEINQQQGTSSSTVAKPADAKNLTKLDTTSSEKSKETPMESLNASERLLSNIPFLPEESDEITQPQQENSIEFIEEASQLIGEKLLLGWTLLEDVCEAACDGNVPLMKDPKKGQKYCVMCGYVSDNLLPPSSIDPPKRNTEPNNTTQQKIDPLEDEDFNDDAVLASYKKQRLHELTQLSPAASAAPVTLPPSMGSDTDRYVADVLNKVELFPSFFHLLPPIVEALLGSEKT